MERRLLFFFGPAQLGEVGKQPDRSQNRTAGVQGKWELHRDSTGRTYLVRADENEQDTNRPPADPEDEPREDQ